MSIQKKKERKEKEKKGEKVGVGSKGFGETGEVFSLCMSFSASISIPARPRNGSCMEIALSLMTDWLGGWDMKQGGWWVACFLCPDGEPHWVLAGTWVCRGQNRGAACATRARPRAPGMCLQPKIALVSPTVTVHRLNCPEVWSPE